MPTRTPFTDHPESIRLPLAAAPVPADGPGHASVETSRLLLRMSYAEPRLAVLAATGDLDLATAPRLAELLWPRLMTELPAIVIDLSAVTFLGVAGLELLAAAHTYAGHRGIALSVVNSTRVVDRALAAGGLDATLPCFASVSDAVDAQRPSRPTTMA